MFLIRRISWLRAGFSVLTLFLILLVSSAMASEAPIRVDVDEKPVTFAVNPKNANGTTIVQLRPLFEALNIEIKWKASTQTVEGKKGSNSFSLRIDSRSASVNGKTVTLSSPGRNVNGNTLVPLRFVGEATGAAVGWNAAGRQITIYSEEYIRAQGWSREEAQRRANAGSNTPQSAATNPPATGASSAGSKLSGLYASHSLDLLNAAGCNGVCWDTFYFIDDSHVLTELPESGAEGLTCSGTACLTYKTGDGKLTLSNGKSYSLTITQSGDLLINGEEYTRYKPLNGLALEGTYKAAAFAGQSGTTLAKSDTYVFRKDGTFLNTAWTGTSSDGSDNGGTGTGVSTTTSGGSEASGTYKISGYTITFQYKDGTQVRKMFFASGAGNDYLRIGGGDYVQQEMIKPYQDILSKQGMASKEVFKERTPGFKEELGGIGVELIGYQWANLSIKEAHKKNFSDFGDGGIIELTVKYKVTNRTSQPVNINNMKNTMKLDGLNATLQETEQLRSKADELKPGASIERLGVFLFPAPSFKQIDSMELVLTNVQTKDGQDLFKGQKIEFAVFD